MKNQFTVCGDCTLIHSSHYRGEYPIDILIDTEDLEKVSEYPNRWSVVNSGGNFYAKMSIRYSGVPNHLQLHRIIMGCTQSTEIVDHINLNTLDNRKSNLRVVTRLENNQNKRGAYKNNLLGYRGVKRCKNRYVVTVGYNSSKSSKYFITLEEAVAEAVSWRNKLYNLPFVRVPIK